MKKLILLFVCAFLSFTFVNASDVSESKMASSDTQLEVVTLDLVFSSFVGVSYDTEIATRETASSFIVLMPGSTALTRSMYTFIM